MDTVQPGGLRACIHIAGYSQRGQFSKVSEEGTKQLQLGVHVP